MIRWLMSNGRLRQRLGNEERRAYVLFRLWRHELQQRVARQLGVGIVAEHAQLVPCTILAACLLELFGILASRVTSEKLLHLPRAWKLSG